MGKIFQDKLWLFYVAFFIPFLVVIISLQGLTVQFQTSGVNDEASYHYPTILKFSGEFPHVDLSDYHSATAPLFHFLFMLAGKVVGFEIYKLRLLNTFISFLTVIVLFRFLHFRVSFPRREALAYSFIFLLSPYFLGKSFVLFTDNLALLWGILSIDYFYRYNLNPSRKNLLFGCIFMSLILITRQSSFWLVIIILFYVLKSGKAIKLKVRELVIVFLALLPLCILIIQWKGLVPPEFSKRHISYSLSIRPIEFMVALMGLYSIILNSEDFLDIIKSNLGNLKRYIFPILASLGLLIIAPLSYRYPGDVGYLWRMATFFPVYNSTALLFWILVPLGAVSLYRMVQINGLNSFPMVFLASFLVVSMASLRVHQRYFDAYALIILFLFLARQKHISPLKYVSMLALMVGFIAYVFVRCGFEGLE